MPTKIIIELKPITVELPTEYATGIVALWNSDPKKVEAKFATSGMDIKNITLYTETNNQIKRLCDSCRVDQSPLQKGLACISDRYGNPIGLFCDECAAIANELVEASSRRKPDKISTKQVRQQAIKAGITVI